MLTSFAKTHIGQRKNNEDSILVNKEMGLYIVADGVGGLNKGEVASQLACDTVLKCINSGQSLENAIMNAHQTIINQIQSNQTMQGMATTIAAVLLKDYSYEIAWVGDSRVYLWDKKLKLLTRDDSYVEKLLESGHITIEELEVHPDRNVISQALGVERKKISVHTNHGILEKNQTLLICSDGLYTIAKEIDLITALQNSQNIENITNSLVHTAVDKGGKDNISLITIKAHNIDKEGIQKQEPRIYRNFDRHNLDSSPAQSNDSIMNRNAQVQELNENFDPKDMKLFNKISFENKNRADIVLEQSDQEIKKSNYLMLILLVTFIVSIGVFLL